MGRENRSFVRDPIIRGSIKKADCKESAFQKSNTRWSHFHNNEFCAPVGLMLRL